MRKGTMIGWIFVVLFCGSFLITFYCEDPSDYHLLEVATENSDHIITGIFEGTIKEVIPIVERFDPNEYQLGDKMGWWVILEIPDSCLSCSSGGVEKVYVDFFSVAAGKMFFVTANPQIKYQVIFAGLIEKENGELWAGDGVRISIIK